MLPSTRLLRRSDFSPILSPDDDGKDLPELRLVEIEEGRTAASGGGEAGGDDLSADGRGLADVGSRLSRSEAVPRERGDGKRDNGERDN